jgi:RHS repeat-associated protein
VDDQLQLDAWGVDGLTTHTVDLDLAAGDHTLRFQSVEYTGGATAQLTWALRTPVVLASGESLGENQTRVSLDGQYRLQYQGDGNLVVVRLADETCAWSSQTNGTSVGPTIMQGDGNLVVYNADWTAVWHAGTWGHDGARLEIANDEMAIVAPGGTRLWVVSLLPSAPGAATTDARAGALAPPRGPFGDASARRLGATSATSPLVVALLALCGLVLWRLRDRRGRRFPALRPFDLLRVAPSNVEGRRTQGRPELGRGTATAVTVTALLPVPATALAQTATQVVEFYYTDAIGSVRAVTKQVNGTWQVVARHDFMPASARHQSTASYGGPRRSAGRFWRPEGGPFGEEIAPPSPPQDKRLFTGKERDQETGQDYFEARYLRGGLGRFTTVDPLASSGYATNPQSWNRYAFGLKNPLRIGDPLGLEPTEYYDTDGKWVGTDGEVDGVFALITNSETARRARAQQKARGSVNPATVPVADQVTLGPLDREAVQWVYDNTGWENEAAAAVGYTPTPGYTVLRATIAQPAERGASKVSVYLPDVTCGVFPRTVIHGHPGDPSENGRPKWNQQPTDPEDLRWAFPHAANLVVGKGDGLVYFFNGNGTYATVPLQAITKLKKR